MESKRAKQSSLKTQIPCNVQDPNITKPHEAAKSSPAAKDESPKMPMYMISSWTQNTDSLRKLLTTSKGRDKFSQLLQYSANFYIACMRSNPTYE